MIELDLDFPTYLRRKVPTVPTYNDAEVCAAFNSCFDLDKWRKLPESIKIRAKELICHHRMKPVCFFDHCGFGLRVFQDKLVITITNDDEGVLEEGQKQGQVDLGGFWLRCPGHSWQPVIEYLVMSEDGRKFWRENVDNPAPPKKSDIDKLLSDEDEDEDEEEDTTPAPKSENGAPAGYWVGSRHRATKYKGKEAAEKAAALVKGITVIS